MTSSAPGLDGPFSLADGRRAGLTDSALRSAPWNRPFAGVRSFDETDDPRSLARAYAPKMKPEAFFSHTTSALLLGMWLPLALQTQMLVHVSVPPHVRAPRDRLVKGHHLIERPGLVMTRQGLRIATARETWCQLATVLGLEDLVVAGESLLAKNRRDRISLRALTTAVEAGDRPRQSLLNRALPELRVGVRSAKETALRRLLVAAGLPEPEINGDIWNAGGEWVAECDLVYRDRRVVVEYEGMHHFELRQGRRDVQKYELFRSLGWTVVRVVEGDLADPAVLAGRVRAALGSAA